MPNPFKAVFNLKKDELPFSILMSFYFFLVITSFWILKPIKKALFIQFYDQTGFTLWGWKMLASQAELLAKVLNMVVAYLAVITFSWLVRRFIRHQLTLIFSIFLMFCYIVYYRIINVPSDVTVWTFYLYGDLFNTLMVATFFAFLNDSVNPDTAKRAYGLIVFGGVAGGAFGSLFVAARVNAFSYNTWILICGGLLLLIATVAVIAGRMVQENPIKFRGVQKTNPDSQAQEGTIQKGNPALEGARLVLKSPYLLSIVGIVGLYEMVSQIMDFQFTETIAHYLDGARIGQQIAIGQAIGNVTALIVQLFFTSFIMTRFGVRSALLVLPVTALSWSLIYLMFPILWVGTLLFTADNGFSYSINQSSKETLYVPTTKDEKYKAKAFIDMFVQRFAKVLAIGLSLIITTVFTEFGAFRWLSLISALILIVWIMAARYAGRTFETITSS